ncbi:MAG: hypothetical protein M0Q22_06170 [Sulfuritalea sp.]|nr:hypothetical protein [Sulfuritalea sp.]
MKMLFALGMLVFSVGSAFAAAMTMQECNAFSLNENKQFPRRVDEITTARITLCVWEDGEITFEYVLDIDVKKGKFSQKNIDALVPVLTTKWCSEAGFRTILDRVAIGYTYYDKSINYIGNIHLNNREC